MYRRKLMIIVLLFSSLLLFASGGKEQAPSKPIVAVSILPHAYFVDSIAKDVVETVTLVGEGQNPHSYEPSPSQMARLAQAEVWLLSGTEFELALKPKIERLYPKLKIIDTTEGMIFRTLEEDDHHHHDPSGLNIDRHTWLGEAQAQVLLSHATKAIIALLPPADQKVVQERSASLSQEITTTFAQLREELSELKGRTVFVYHPSFGYFLDSFGINQAAVETGGKEPTARELERLIAQAKAEEASVIFVQKQFPLASAQRVAQAVGARVVALDPLAYQWLDTIRHMGEELKENL